MTPNCLVICRTLAGLPRLAHLRVSGPMVVASDDPSVQREARSLPNVHKIIFIEKMESFFAVAIEVRRAFDEINGWLASFARPDADVTADSLSWGVTVEGGLTTQRVQDAFLLIRSYHELLESTQAAEVWVIAEPATRWDDKVFRAVVLARKLPLHVCPTNRLRNWVGRWWVRLRPIAMYAYRLVSILRLGGARLRRPDPLASGTCTVLFQLCGPETKHVENVVPLMQALQRRGERPVAACWDAAGRFPAVTSVAQIVRNGIAAHNVVRWCTVGDVLICGMHAFGTAWRIWRRRASDSRWKRIEFGGVSIAPLLGESLWHFIMTELPSRLLYQRALSACISELRPLALKTWSGPERFEAKVALRLLKPLCSPLVLHYWLGASMKTPYIEGKNGPDLFLAQGPHEALIAMHDYGLAENQVVVVGQARFSSLIDFAACTPPVVSRRELGLPDHYDMYVGFDPNGVLRGSLSAREQVEMLMAVLNAARNLPNTIVIIKPHPTYPIEHLQPLLESAALTNVVVLQPAVPVSHFLNAVDVLVSKHSTLILEAALMKRPSISPMFDCEKRFRIYGEIPEIVTSADELERLLIRLCMNNHEFILWQTAQFIRHRTQLPLFYHLEPVSASDIAAETVVQRLAGRR